MHLYRFRSVWGDAGRERHGGNWPGGAHSTTLSTLSIPPSPPSRVRVTAVAHFVCRRGGRANRRGGHSFRPVAGPCPPPRDAADRPSLEPHSRRASDCGAEGGGGQLTPGRSRLVTVQARLTCPDRSRRRTDRGLPSPDCGPTPSGRLLAPSEPTGCFSVGEMAHEGRTAAPARLIVGVASPARAASGVELATSWGHSEPIFTRSRLWDRAAGVHRERGEGRPT